ncbi:MAG: undecaprenyl-phosphate glucose phosphotransferase [Pseudomonadota bacterium]
MTTAYKNIGNGFSREAIKQAIAKEKISSKRKVELNELAEQVAEQFSTKSVSPFIVSGFVRLFDFLALAALGVTVLVLQNMPEASLLSMQAAGAVSGALFIVAFLQGIDGYLITSLRGFAYPFSKAITALTMALIVMLLFVFVINGIDNIPINGLARWFSASAIFLMISRFVVGQLVHRMMEEGRLERRAVIVGGGQPAAELIYSIEASATSDIRICGIFDDRTDERSPEIVAGYPKLGNVAELVEFARKARITMLIVAIPVNAEKRVLQLLKRLWVLPVDIRLSAHANKMLFRPRSYSYEGSVPMLDVYDRPIADWDSVTKRIFDVSVASLAILLLSPIMLLTAIAVKLDSRGPIIFKQKREGFNNEEIEIFKFRSLYTDQGDCSGINVVTKDDDRVTRVGKFIRKTSIDELPQLFNVLLGTLSLVGPRPHVANAQTDNKLWAEVVDSYIARHRVKPGVTGWAQVNGWRGEIDSEEKLQGRVEHDLYYIENWSLLFDMYILAITPLKLMNTENAY